MGIAEALLAWFRLDVCTEAKRNLGSDADLFEGTGRCVALASRDTQGKRTACMMADPCICLLQLGSKFG